MLVDEVLCGRQSLDRRTQWNRRTENRDPRLRILLHELAQPLQTLAVGKIQVEQDRIDVGFAAVDIERFAQRAGFQPFQRYTVLGRNCLRTWVGQQTLRATRRRTGSMSAVGSVSNGRHNGVSGIKDDVLINTIFCSLSGCRTA